MSKPWANKAGEFKRQISEFREIISNTHPVFKPERNRYWLYVSLACPWAHRTLITRHLMGLNDIIGVSVVHWHLDDDGWRFVTNNNNNSSDDGKGPNDEIWYTPTGGVHPKKEFLGYGIIKNDSKREFVDGSFDPHYGIKRLRELYLKANPNYEARVTVPVLWDTKTGTIVNNESSEIVDMFASGVFNELIENNNVNLPKLYPNELKNEIDKFNDWVYDGINNGVYKAGFAENGEVYEQEVRKVFGYLDRLEKILEKKYNTLAEGYTHPREILNNFYCIGEQLTTADIRLYTTIARFDTIYVQHFKCNLNTIRSGYPFVHLWLKNIYWNHDAFKETTNFNHIKLHYSRSHPRINPIGITPLGPEPHIETLSIRPFYN